MSEISLTRFKVCAGCGCTKPATSQFFHKSGKRLYLWCRPWRNLSRRKRTPHASAGKYRTIIDGDWLRHRYEVELCTMQDIANELGCSTCTVWRRLKLNGIESRPQNVPTITDHRKRRLEIDQSPAGKARYARYRHSAKGKAMRKAAKVRRKTRERKADGCHSTQDILRQYEEQDGKCYWGGGDLISDYHVDHYIPLIRGGSNDPENIVLSCPYHNLSKNNKLPSEFLSGDIGLCR